MFERFTQEARNVIVIAQREAKELAHSYIGSEHLLLGLTLDLGHVGATLRLQGTDHLAVQDKIIEIIGRGNTTPAGHSPFTPRSREMLRRADDISRHHGHGYVGTQHLALAVLASHDSVACQALKKLDVSLPELARSITAGFDSAYTAGLVFQGFTAADKDGRCDINPLRSAAEDAAEDGSSDLAVQEIRITLNAGEYFTIVGADPADNLRYLDYHQARAASAKGGGLLHVSVPKLKQVTARTAAGTDVVIAETVEWELVPLRHRIEVLSRD